MPNYRQGNYDYVVNSSFQPFTLQELSYFPTQYQAASEKMEQAYTDMADTTTPLDYLRTTLPEGSVARQRYEKFANDFNKAADRFYQQGLGPEDRGNWLNLRRRMRSEIGSLLEAEKTAKALNETNDKIRLQDPTRLFSQYQYSIDDVLDGKRPNTYSVSGNDLYKRGMQIGASVSSRMYSDPQVKQLTDQYNNIIQTQGMSPELLQRFQADLSTLPAVQKEVQNTLNEFQVPGNLSPQDNARALQSVVSGIVNGAAYKQSNTVQANPDYLNPAQRQQMDFTARNQSLREAQLGIEWDPKAKQYKPVNPANPTAPVKPSSSSSRSSGTTHIPIYGQGVRVEWHGDDPTDDKEFENRTETSYTPNSEEVDHVGPLTSYEDLPEYAKNIVQKYIGKGRFSMYNIWFRPYKGNWLNDTEAGLEIEPKKSVVYNSEDGGNGGVGSGNGVNPYATSTASDSSEEE